MSILNSIDNIKCSIADYKFTNEIAYYFCKKYFKTRTQVESSEFIKFLKDAFPTINN